MTEVGEEEAKEPIQETVEEATVNFEANLAQKEKERQLVEKIV